MHMSDERENQSSNNSNHTLSRMIVSVFNAFSTGFSLSPWPFMPRHELFPSLSIRPLLLERTHLLCFLLLNVVVLSFIPLIVFVRFGVLLLSRVCRQTMLRGTSLF